MNAARRVAVTGIGAVTPIGHGADGLWHGVLANRSAVRAIDRFDASPFPSRIAAQVDGFDPADHLDARRARRLDRFSQLSVASARMAATHAGWARAMAATGGPGSGSVRRWAASHSVRSSTPPTSRAACAPWRRPWPPPSSAAPGPRTWPSTWASTGRRSATRTRARRAPWPSARHSTPFAPGIVDVALAGGAEAPLAPLTFGAFAMIRVLSPRNDDPGHRLAPLRRRTATGS